MPVSSLTYSPTLNPGVICTRLSGLLRRGVISDPVLNDRIARLEQSFRRYTHVFPYGLWAPGLVITHEIRALSDLLLPMEDLKKVFGCFFAKALLFSPFPGASPIDNAVSWPDALQKLQPAQGANPALMLQFLLKNETERCRFLFQNFLPDHYGGNFNRYPEQLVFLSRWLRESTGLSSEPLQCLDAACSSGEGTYDLVKLLLGLGLSPGSFRVRGTTLEPLELFAAAHCFFPHNAKRQAAVRHHVQPLLDEGISPCLTFCLEDLTLAPAAVEEFHIILCNGVLGGPFLHDHNELERVVASLARRLKTGGVLVAADRFHDGWKKKVPVRVLAEMMTRNGMVVREAGDGLAAIKTGSALRPRRGRRQNP